MSPVREPIFSRLAVALADAYTDTATFILPGRLDKLDVITFEGDALVQFKPWHSDEWLPTEGVALRAGLFQSLPDLSAPELFGRAGVIGCRFKRSTAGVASSVDVRAWLV